VLDALTLMCESAPLATAAPRPQTVLVWGNAIMVALWALELGHPSHSCVTAGETRLFVDVEIIQSPFCFLIRIWGYTTAREYRGTFAEM
jgi:hypothetical protein